MEKKNFFKILLISLAVTGITFLFSCKGKTEKFAGIQLYSLRDDMSKDVPGTLEKLGQIGYKFVEAAGYSDGKFYGMEPVEFKDLVEKNGMQFLGSHSGIPAPDAAHWDSAMMWWDKCIAAHKAAGVTYIVQPYMTNEAYENIADLAKYCKYFNAVGEKCNKEGIRFGYHNHDKEFSTVLNDTIVYDYMLQNLKPENVAMELDLYWIKKGGKDAVEYFKKYPGRFEFFHVKDETELGGSDAIVDFKPIFENADEAGLKYYIIEVERYNFEPVESVKKSFEFIQNADYIKK